ncbi:PilZ domain-containing protein [Devosia sp.]|uniref:PilZ domain-containing protein n=1 Tax=Devosia sp. TaxID=1871048 RepID=UPI0032668C2A
MTGNETGDNGRANPRQRTLKGGKIALNDGYSTIDCTVRNLSATGALLRVTSIIGVPDQFKLVMNDGRSFDCKIAWKRETELGVAFI